MSTSIEWTDATWNPVRGCRRVSPGCVNCYAERMAARNLPGMKSPTTGEAFAIVTDSGPRWTGKVELIESKLQDPLHWKKPRRVFVNSMSDLFHESLSDEAIDRVFAVMAQCPQHTFQILTKRAHRMRRLLAAQRPPSDIADMWPLQNVWLGVSVENPDTAAERIPELVRTPAAVRFVSYEPALAAINWESFLGPQCRELHQHKPELGCWAQLDWIIIGGESGPGARLFDLQWARNTIRDCKAAGVACFVKQLGARPIQILPTRSGPMGAYQDFEDNKGGDMSEWPEDLRVREYP